MKVKIITGYIPSGYEAGAVQGFALAKLPEGTMWFKVTSHYSSTSEWAFHKDINGEGKHELFDEIFGKGNWEKTWVGKFPESKANWTCSYCTYHDKELYEYVPK